MALCRDGAGVWCHRWTHCPALPSPLAGDTKHLHADVAKGRQMQLAKITDGAKIRPIRAHNRDEGQVALAARAILRLENSAARWAYSIGIPSSWGQKGAPLGSLPHREYRNGPSPNEAWYRARKTPGRPAATWSQSYELPAGSARASRADMVCHGHRSSSISVCRFDKKRNNREVLLSPFI